MRTVSVRQLDVHGSFAATANIILYVELKLLTLLEGVKHARRQGGVMEENFLIRLGAHESKSAITD